MYNYFAKAGKKRGGLPQSAGTNPPLTIARGAAITPPPRARPIARGRRAMGGDSARNQY